MSCRYNAQQRPLTTIADASAPLADLTFPALTICNVNQVGPQYPSAPSTPVCPGEEERAGEGQHQRAAERLHQHLPRQPLPHWTKARAAAG